MDNLKVLKMIGDIKMQLSKLEGAITGTSNGEDDDVAVEENSDSEPMDSDVEPSSEGVSDSPVSKAKGLALLLLNKKKGP